MAEIQNYNFCPADEDILKRIKGVKMVNRHDASGQMGGYLYQSICALWLLLKTENTEAQIVIEKFDDIAFMEREKPIAMIQTKHQLYQQGNLGDTSVDFWRTLNSWIDTIDSVSLSIEETKFFILTTASANENSIATLLSYENRDVNNALSKMENIAKEDAQKNNSAFYKKFLMLSEEKRKQLTNNIYIISNVDSIDSIKGKIMPYIRMATISKYEDSTYQKVLGWWIIQIIEGLKSQEPKIISYNDLRHRINDIGGEYKADSLPIDIDFAYLPTEEELKSFSGEEKIFIEQIKLIARSDDTIKRCIKDYYNAYLQRSKWVREQVLYTDDLMLYELKLKEEWDRKFQYMREDLRDYGTEISEEKKISAGTALFREIENLDIRLKNVSEPFIMRGTYHGLANKLEVGWHVDFYNRLIHLLKGDLNEQME